MNPGGCEASRNVQLAFHRRHKGIYYGWTILGLVFLIGLFTAGITQGFGVFIGPMTDEFGWSRANISLAVSIFAIMSAVTPPLAGRISDRYGPRIVLTIGVAFNAIGMTLMATSQSLAQVYIFYGLFIGIGFGFTGVAATTALISRWFVRRRGMALSFAAAGLGVGQLFLTPLTTVIILRFSWQAAFATIGIMSATLIPLTFLILRREPPPHADEEPDEKLGPDELEAPPTCITNEMIRENLDSAWSSRSFWMLASGFMSCGFTIFFLTAHLVPLAVDNGISLQQAGLALGLTGGASIVSNLMIAGFSDRVPRKYILAGLYGLRAVSILILFVAFSAPILYGAAILFGLSRANAAVVSATTIDLFGRNAVGSIVGYLFMYHQLFAAAGAFFGGLVYDMYGSYDIMLVAAFLAMVNGTVASLLIQDRTPASPELDVSREPALAA